jgi:hypothetical protein
MIMEPSFYWMNAFLRLLRRFPSGFSPNSKTIRGIFACKYVLITSFGETIGTIRNFVKSMETPPPKAPVTIEYDKPTAPEIPPTDKKTQQDDAKLFLQTAKEKLPHESFSQFRDNLKKFRTNQMTADQLIESVLILFEGECKEELLKGKINI